MDNRCLEVYIGGARGLVLLRDGETCGAAMCRYIADRGLIAARIGAAWYACSDRADLMGTAQRVQTDTRAILV